MEVKEFQSRIVKFGEKWDKLRNCKSTKELAFFHLVEEVGELSREYVNKFSRKDRFSKKELENAIGDIFIQLIRLSHLYNLDIEEAVNKIIKDDEEKYFNK